MAEKKEMVKIEKQLYKKEVEEVTLIMPDGKRQKGTQEKKIASGTQSYEVEKAFYEKYLKNKKGYWLAGSKGSAPKESPSPKEEKPKDGEK